MNVMHGMRITVFVLVAFACGAIGYAGYDVYQRYAIFADAAAKDKARMAQIAANRAALNTALTRAGVSLQQATSGFWYTIKDADGAESVLYYDPDQWASYALSPDDMQALASHVGGAERFDADSMKNIAEADLPPTLRFHNALYSNTTPGAFRDALAVLERAYGDGSATSDDLWRLSYMYELQGAYEKRDEVNAANCARFRERCKSDIVVRLAGVVQDMSGNPVQGASVSVLGHDEVKTAYTDEKGAYALSLSVKTMEKLRLSATKRNFSSGVASIVIIDAAKKTYRADPITLASAITIVTIDTARHTVNDPDDLARQDGSFVLHATSSSYDIPADAIVDGTGRPYRGPVDVYIYEFTRETVPESLVTLDTFDQVMGYAGNLMLSYGMPFIQFFTATGEALDVTDKKPMTITYKIAGMKELRENTDGVLPRPLTDADMATLVAASKGDPGFPITAEFLARNELYTFPPFWVMDRGSGVWDNVGMRVVDASGVIQAPFYTIKNK